MFTGARRTLPLACLLNDLLDYIKLDDFFYVGLVVGPLEHSVLTVVFYAKEVLKLQPQIL